MDELEKIGGAAFAGAAGAVRVRFAPSPTGYLHIGGARTALFNWLFAARNGGRLVLRIEDTDLSRKIEDSTRQITSTLKWLGLQWDEGPGVGGPVGPYFQSERLALYHQAAETLTALGAAYECFCTPEELAERRAEARRLGQAPRYDGRCRDLTEDDKRRLAADGRRPVLRIKVPTEGTTVVEDLIRGTVVFENALLDDFVIMKSDGTPTYNFACVIDDHTMGITHVLRADEHLSNTPKQIVAYRAFGWDCPAFAHVPMILAPDRSKLSKRHGAASVEEFQEAGYLPEAIVNYLAFLGWSPEGGEEVLRLEDMKQQFSLDRVSKNAAIYDINKLTWMNGHYIRTIDLDRLTDAALPFMIRAGLIGEPVTEDRRDYVKAILTSLRDRIKTLGELPEAAAYFFRDDFDYDPKGVQKYLSQPDVADLLDQAREILAGLERFDQESCEAAYRGLIEGRGLKGGALIHPTRVALSGRTAGPSLFEILALLGRERTLGRLARASALVRAGGPWPGKLSSGSPGA
ncbi:MAG TPA: glutamate--tRNA ligase [Bacillota bacterium]|jgi:glutamyl-tRNA synthetase